MAGQDVRLVFDSDSVAVITMCNEENKFSVDFIDSFMRILDKVEKNPDCKALITRGEGKFFSSGLDIGWIRSQEKEILNRYHDKLWTLCKRILTFGVPTVAVINGHAFSDGAFLALVHDYRVMRSDRGYISWPEVHFKLPFMQMMSIFMAKLPPGKIQTEVIVYGKRFDAKAAKELVLVDITAEESQLLPQAKSIIQSLFKVGPLDRSTLSMMKMDVYGRYVEEKSKL
ncbi:hypothetical protein CHS0354_009374 [Potamilus streckersoni]|uniref:Uncharacterized protein n=1 Tax=Potamilus streckersoni TaxID=2493646 RepID=A0AAE0W6L4_9BIVA|nr:hypothetical protein CHS0354_009374 [Potamilus streckersoni]